MLRVHNLTLKLCICHFRNRKCDPKEQEKTLLLLDPFETSRSSIHSAHGQTVEDKLESEIGFRISSSNQPSHGLAELLAKMSEQFKKGQILIIILKKMGRSAY